MLRFSLSLFAVLLLSSCSPSANEAQTPEISAARIAEATEFLARDEMQGRGPGTPGETLATNYIADEFKLAGAAPAAGDSYFQQVPLVSIEPNPSSSLSWSSGGAATAIPWADGFVGLSHRQEPDVSVDADVVFVGHGIVAPEFGWDDYKDADVAGKIVLLFTNEPPSDDPAFFGGRALTYYGRWSFKYEEAVRQGAAGVLIVHTDETAGYPWSVVRNSWGGRNPYVKLAPDEQALALAGWTTGEAGERMLQQSVATRDLSLNQLLALANGKDFSPIPLNAKIQAHLVSVVENFETRNVVAKIEGSDPLLRDQAVVLTAHWDHLGVGEPDADGDAIFNGAVDNATGCALLLELARAFGSLEQKPARTMIFAAVGAEEGGLRGSAYYAQHPIIPAGKTAANLNFDGFLPLPVTASVSLAGYERTTLKPLVEAVAAEFGYELDPDPNPEQGYYYRSDHFSLAKAGIPAFSVSLGNRVIGKPAGWGEEQETDYREHRYHQQADEFDPSWDFSGLAKLTEFSFELGRRIANQPGLPTWQAGDEFLPARQASQDN
jgi:Zn-dependent M28 family amino/carboxypeptidase